MSVSLEQRIRFCTSRDGVRIAAATTGAGPPLVKAANWLNHLEFDNRSPVWRHWIRELSRDHTLVRYDERGCGLSEWEVEDFSLDAWVRDLETVVDDLELERFALLGISQGGPIAVAYAARHPERVSRLILYGSYARGRSHRDLSEREREEGELMRKMIEVGWGTDHAAFRQAFTSMFIPEANAEQSHWFNELERVSATPQNAARILSACHALDVRALAPRLTTPSLVLHVTQDLRVPHDEGRLLASLIPGARFVTLEGRNHLLLGRRARVAPVPARSARVPRSRESRRAHRRRSPHTRPVARTRLRCRMPHRGRGWRRCSTRRSSWPPPSARRSWSAPARATGGCVTRWR